MAPYLSACGSENGMSRWISGATPAPASRPRRRLTPTSSALAPIINMKAENALTSASGARISSSVALRAIMATIASMMPR